MALGTVAAAVTGRDITMFEGMRSADPNRYVSLKKTLRFNGPLVAIMCFAIVVGAPIASINDEVTGMQAMIACAVFGILLWLSVRWTLWAYS